MADLADTTTNTHNQTRRDLLKKVAVGGAVAWTAPLVISSPVFATTGVGGSKPCENYWFKKFEGSSDDGTGNTGCAVYTSINGKTVQNNPPAGLVSGSYSGSAGTINFAAGVVPIYIQLKLGNQSYPKEWTCITFKYENGSFTPVNPLPVIPCEEESLTLSVAEDDMSILDAPVEEPTTSEATTTTAAATTTTAAATTTTPATTTTEATTTTAATTTTEPTTTTGSPAGDDSEPGTETLDGPSRRPHGKDDKCKPIDCSGLRITATGSVATGVKATIVRPESCFGGISHVNAIFCN